VLGLGACDPPREGDADVSSPSAAAAGTEQPRAATAPVTRAASPASSREHALTPASLDITLVEIRDRGDTMEVELACDRHLPSTDASRPTLQVGDEIVRASFHPQGRLDRLVFLVPRAQFDRMPGGAVMTVRVRALSNESMTQAPVLDKTKVVTP
jgi:hypothetical protein